MTESIVKILCSIIGFQFAILGLFVKFAFTKATNFIKQQEETNKQLALINQSLCYQKEISDKHDIQIINLNDRFASILSRIAYITAKKEERHA